MDFDPFAPNNPAAIPERTEGGQPFHQQHHQHQHHEQHEQHQHQYHEQHQQHQLVPTQNQHQYLDHQQQQQHQHHMVVAPPAHQHQHQDYGAPTLLQDHISSRRRVHNIVSGGSPSSVASQGSHSSAHSSVYSGTSALQDKAFAPPPKMPASLQSSQLSPEQAARLPDFAAVKHSGRCLARLSLKSMITKKWKSTFWIAYGDTQILFFRSIHDFEECFANPYLGEDEKKKLVKLKIDFINDLDQPNINGYTVSRTNTKSYPRDGYISHFKVEKWDNYGPTVWAALGGKNETEVNSLRTIMKEMIQISQQRSRSKQTGNGDDYGSRNGYDHSSASPYGHEQPSGRSYTVDSSEGAGPAYSYEQDNNAYNNGDGRTRESQRSNSMPRGTSNQRLKGMLRSFSKEPNSREYSDGRDREAQRYNSRPRATSNPRLKSMGTGILKKVQSLSKLKKKKSREEDVQYYVGRPSTQKEYEYRPAETDYGF